MEKDLYIIQKHIMAESVEDALKRESKFKVNEIFIDSEWRKNKIEKLIDKKFFNN